MLVKSVMGRYADGNAFLIAQACAYRWELHLAFEWLECAYKQNAPELSQVK